MIVNLVEKYDKLVQAWSVSEFDQVGPNLRFKGKVIFIDNSVIFVRQIVLGETTFKYAYHWQNREGQRMVGLPIINAMGLNIEKGADESTAMV